MLVEVEEMVFDVEGLTFEGAGLDSPILLDAAGTEKLGLGIIGVG